RRAAHGNNQRSRARATDALNTSAARLPSRGVKRTTSTAAFRARTAGREMARTRSRITRISSIRLLKSRARVATLLSQHGLEAETDYIAVDPQPSTIRFIGRRRAETEFRARFRAPSVVRAFRRSRVATMAEY